MTHFELPLEVEIELRMVVAGVVLCIKSFASVDLSLFSETLSSLLTSPSSSSISSEIESESESDISESSSDDGV
jgi:hypothetical protein